MDGPQKVATLLLALDPGVAAGLLGRFDDDQKAELVELMLSMDYIDSETVAQVLAEFDELCAQESHAIAQPEARIKGILSRTLGESEADTFLRDHDPRVAADPFAALERLGAQQLSDLLKPEHPQTIAIVLSRLSAPKAGEVLSALPDELTTDVVGRMVTGEDSAPPEVVESIGRVLSDRVGAMTSRSDPWATRQGRVQLVANLLTAASPSARDAALQAVRDRDPEAGEQVRQLMFLFDDLPSLKGENLRKVIGALDTQLVALALKTASDEVKEAVFGAVSKRAGETLREELELLGPRPLSEVERAQRTIVETIRRLQEEGEITIARGEEQMV